MTRIRIKSDEILYITRFESMTGAKVRDCVSEENALGFLINTGSMGKAIGRAGTNIERVRKAFGKDILLMEYHENKTDFIKNMFEPVKIKAIRLREGSPHTIAEVEVDRKDRRRILGHGGNRLRLATKLARRHKVADEINVRLC